MNDSTTTVLGSSRHVDLDCLRHSSALELLEPQDPGLDLARSVWNTTYEHDPLAVVRPASAVGVAEAVAFSREHAAQEPVREIMDALETCESNELIAVASVCRPYVADST